MNECTYLGRICTDLVLNKKAMDDKENYWTRFRLAVARKRVKKEGEKDTDFFNCVAFGSAAKGICTYAKKGGRICVCGENRENVKPNIHNNAESHNINPKDQTDPYHKLTTCLD